MKVMVFGGSGMLGHVVVRHLVDKGHDVTFSTRGKTPRWLPFEKPVGFFKFTVSDKIPDLTDFDWAINCIGAIKQDKSLTTSDFYETNAVFPWKLALVCKKTNTKLIHVSSDCVFSGDLVSGSYHAGDPRDARDDYGVSKALGECSDAVVIRTSMIGPAEKNLGLFQWLLTEEDNVILGYTNHLWSGVTTLFLAQFMEGLMADTSVKMPSDGGLIQIATDPMDKCSLLETIQEVFVEPENRKTIIKTKADTSVNRGLVPSVRPAPAIREQLIELKDWMKTHEN